MFARSGELFFSLQEPSLKMRKKICYFSSAQNDFYTFPILTPKKIVSACKNEILSAAA
jgi:hypothetical protein